MSIPLTQGRVLRFYLPLAVNSILMMIEMPAVTAGISRLPEPELHLAAYGVLMSLSYILVNLAVPLTHSGNALGRSRQAFRLLRNFSLAVCGAVTLISALIYFTPLYDVVVEGLLGTPTHLAAAARPGIQLMVIAGFAIGWRRFYHGVLIRHGYTNVVAYCTFVRVAALLSIVAAGVYLGRYSGIEVAAAALAFSPAVESAVVTVIAEMILRRPGAIRWESDSAFNITYEATVRFFLPLAMVLALTAAVRPIIAASMTRLPDPVLSLAAFPVAYGVFNLVYSPLYVLPQVVIALVKDSASHLVVARFIRNACVVGWLLLLVASLTPAVETYLAWVLGVPEHVREVALPAVRIMSLYLLIAGWQAQYQGVLVAARQTAWTQLATTANVLALAATLGVGVLVGSLSGIAVGSLAYVIGFAAEALTLRRRAMRVVEQLPTPVPPPVAATSPGPTSGG